MRDRLSAADISEGMKECPNWALSEDHLSIHRNFVFEGFAVAFGFMSEVALVAEKMDHHPEWSNVWRRVAVTLTTHSVKGLTELDFMLAKRMDEIARKRLVLP